MNSYVVREAQRLIARNPKQFQMTVAEAQEYLDNKSAHDIGCWAGSPEGEMMRGHISNMKMCARYAIWVDEVINNAVANL